MDQSGGCRVEGREDGSGYILEKKLPGSVDELAVGSEEKSKDGIMILR